MSYTSTALPPVTPCPKPNHIKPCWCGGKAKCGHWMERNGAWRRCRRWVIGSAMLCWQHR